MQLTTRIGLHHLLALLLAMAAVDAAGMGRDAGEAASDPAPAVIIRSPLPGAVVAGEIAVYAEAGSDAAVSGVQFILFSPGSGRRNLGAEDTSPPYTITWDTADTGDGTHMLAVLARDAAGRRSYAGPVTVTVANGTAGDVIQ